MFWLKFVWRKKKITVPRQWNLLQFDIFRLVVHLYQTKGYPYKGLSTSTQLTDGDKDMNYNNGTMGVTWSSFSTKYGRKICRQHWYLTQSAKKKQKTNKWCRCTPNSGCSFSSPSFNYTTFQTRLLRTQKQGNGCLIRLERCHLCSRGKAFILFLWDTSRLLKGGIFLLTQYRTPRFYFVVHVWCGLGWVTKKTNKILWIINSPRASSPLYGSLHL